MYYEYTLFRTHLIFTRKSKNLHKFHFLNLLKKVWGPLCLLYSTLFSQAREDVIRLLRSELLSRPEKLESRYGSARPSRPLQALQRDGALSSNQTHNNTQHVYDKPMAEVRTPNRCPVTTSVCVLL